MPRKRLAKFPAAVRSPKLLAATDLVYQLVYRDNSRIRL